MLLRASIAAVAFAMSSLTGAPVARADEAYVCDAGRVVYVKPGELEAMKRWDPCIAGYYGLTVSQPASGSSAGAIGAPTVEFKTLDMSSDISGGKQASGSKPSALRMAQAGPIVVHHRAPPAAAPGTDFRNVRLINGGHDSDGWYRHNQ